MMRVVKRGYRLGREFLHQDPIGNSLWALLWGCVIVTWVASSGVAFYLTLTLAFALSLPAEGEVSRLARKMGMQWNSPRV